MKYTIVGIFAMVTALSACQPKTSAPVTAGDTSPVATVDGTPIARGLYEFYIKGMTGGKQPSDLTKDQRDAALDTLVRAYLVAAQAQKDGTTKDPDVTDMLELQRLNYLQQQEEGKYLKDRKPTEQELRTEYETELAAVSHQEYHARHILVATEPFAKKLIEQLEKGGDFADVAKKESMDSKDAGGDLGWVQPANLPKSVADALLALKPGEYTHQPVQSQYGWHIVQLVETRDLAPPTFESVRQRLEQVLESKKFKSYTDDLMKNAKVVKSL